MAQRRTKIEVLNEKISKVDSKIAACTEKIAALEDEKTALAAQLDEIRKAEKKAKEAAERKSGHADAEELSFYKGLFRDQRDDSERRLYHAGIQ